MIRLDITGDLAAMMAAEITAGEKAVTKAVGDAGAGLKTAWREQITSAGLGQRLARMIRGRLFARKTGFGWRSSHPPPANPHEVAGSPSVNGNEDPVCGCGLSIVPGDPACWWPKDGSTPAASVWPRGPKRDAD